VGAVVVGGSSGKGHVFIQQGKLYGSNTTHCLKEHASAFFWRHNELILLGGTPLDALVVCSGVFSERKIRNGRVKLGPFSLESPSLITY
jgi:hypothetical protein